MPAPANLARIEAMYRSHGHLVLRRARAILGNETEAQEVLQDLFTGFTKDPQALLDADSPVAFLYGATTHRCLNVMRNSKNRARLLDARADELTPRVRADAPEPCALLRQVLVQLDETTARAAIYHHVDGMTHAEISEILGCSRRHVGNLLQRLASHASHHLEPSR